MLPMALGAGSAALSLLSSFGQSYLAGRAGNAAFGRSVYAAGLTMQAGEAKSRQYIRLASGHYLDAYRAKQKKRLSLDENRRSNKIIAGRNRGQQQGLESGGTTRSMTVEQQEDYMKFVEDVVEWEWDSHISSLNTAAREANYMANVEYINGINNANATLYSGAQEATSYINSANATLAMAIPNAVMSGVSTYAATGGNFGAGVPTSGITPGNYGKQVLGADTETLLMQKYR